MIICYVDQCILNQSGSQNSQIAYLLITGDVHTNINGLQIQRVIMNIHEAQLENKLKNQCYKYQKIIIHFTPTTQIMKLQKVAKMK